MSVTYGLSEEGRRLKVMSKAHHFAAFYRDVKKAFRSRRLIVHGSVTVRRSSTYSVHRNTPLAIITTPPALAPGAKPKLYIRLR